MDHLIFIIIYYSIVGFIKTEFLRSRQIRENKITRDKALELIKRENKPNFEAIKWYCEKIGNYCEGAIPDPIPNSEVKPFSANGTLS